MKSDKNTIKITQKGSETTGSKMDIIEKFGSGIVIAEILIIVFIGLFVFVIPKWQSVTNDTDGGYTYWQDERAKLESALIDAQKLVKVYNSLNKTEREKLTKILPAGDNIAQLMSQLEALFASEELFIIAMNMVPVDDVMSQNKIKRLEMSITFMAPTNYYQFKDLFKKLESNIRLINIRSLQYSIDGEEFSFVGDAYFIDK